MSTGTNGEKVSPRSMKWYEFEKFYANCTPEDIKALGEDAHPRDRIFFVDEEKHRQDNSKQALDIVLSRNPNIGVATALLKISGFRDIPAYEACYDDNFESAVELALKNPNPEIFLTEIPSLHKGEYVHEVNRIYGTPLICQAAACADIKILERIIELGADINAESQGGYNSLFHADEDRDGKRCVEKAKLLVNTGINVNQKDCFGMNAFSCHIDMKAPSKAFPKSDSLNLEFLETLVNARATVTYDDMKKLRDVICADLPETHPAHLKATEIMGVGEMKEINKAAVLGMIEAYKQKREPIKPEIEHEHSAEPQESPKKLSFAQRMRNTAKNDRGR